MWRSAWIWTMLLGGAAAWGGEEPTSKPTDDALHPEIKQALQRLRQAQGQLNQLQKGISGAMSPGIDQLIEDSVEWEKQIAAACARIQVDPRAEKAAAAMRRSALAPALRTLGPVLAEDADDPYASYLAGICAAELGKFEEGARHFTRVLTREPGSHTARLLSKFCECAAKQQAPLSDEAVLACYDAGLVEAEKHVPAAEIDEEDDLVTTIAKAFRIPETLKDPLIYKLDNEAVAGRGPCAIDVDRLVNAALAADDPYELFFVWLVTPENHTTSELEERLAAPRHAATVRALLFLFNYYGEGDRYQQRGQAFEESLAELQRQMPEEGLWVALGIPHKAPVGDDVIYPPLTGKELAQLEQAVSSPRWTNYHQAVTAAAARVLERAGYPWAMTAAEALSRPVGAPVRAFRNVAMRTCELAKRRFAAGDTDGALAVTHTWCRFVERLEPKPDGSDVGAWLVVSAHRMMVARTVLENLPSSHTQAWLEHQQLRLAARTIEARIQAMGVDYVALVLPVPAISRVYRRLLDGEWAPWELERATRRARAEDELDVRRAALARCLEGVLPPRARDLLDPGILGLRELLPELRRFRDAPLDDETLWMLVWTLGELTDRESIGWLSTPVEDEREWLRITANEALEKITGPDRG